VDVTPTHYSVELLARMKKIVIEQKKCEHIGDKSGSFRAENRAAATQGNSGGAEGAAPGTPFMVGQTPLHDGSATPMYRGGSETPMYAETETPGREESDVNPFRPSSEDKMAPPNATNAAQLGGGSDVVYNREGSQLSQQVSVQGYSIGSDKYSPGNASLTNSLNNSIVDYSPADEGARGSLDARDGRDSRDGRDNNRDSGRDRSYSLYNNLISLFLICYSIFLLLSALESSLTPLYRLSLSALRSPLSALHHS
jgi:transcription elongation factor